MSSSLDPNLDALQAVAKELEPLLGDLVLVGGCAVGLLITDRARPPVRPTVDVDVLTEVTSRPSYYELSDKLRELGFHESRDVICRWRKGELVLDVMPTEGDVLGFTNRWYSLAAKTALESALPNGLIVRHVSPPLFIATKIESFNGRGGGDFLHHDIEDILNIVDGRPELVEEVLAAPQEVREFIEEEIDDLLAKEEFTEVLPWHLQPLLTEQARTQIVLERLRRLAGL